MARLGERVVGYLEAVLHLRDRVYTDGEIVTLVVDATQRRHGAGSRLVGELQRLCVEKRVHMLRVPTQRANLKGIDFYTRCGFELSESDVYLAWLPHKRAREP